jgi:hypothetical protein
LFSATGKVVRTQIHTATSLVIINPAKILSPEFFIRKICTVLVEFLAGANQSKQATFFV